MEDRPKMYAKVDGFSYGLLTPLAAFVAACTGGALGLRGLTRALRTAQPGRAGWLALSSAAFGTSVWVAHFIAMTGFAVAHARVGYDLLMAFAGLGFAIVMVGAGIFVAAYRGMTGRAVFTGGTVTGLGIASMHYMGMAGLRLNGHVEYNTLTVAASVLIAVVASTGALWAVGQGRGPLWNAAGGLAMGLAMLGMHYTGMSAVRVHLYAAAAGAPGAPPVRELGLMLIGPVALLLVLAVILLVVPVRVPPLPSRPFGSSRLPVLPTQRSGGPEPARVRSRTSQNR